MTKCRLGGDLEPGAREEEAMDRAACWTPRAALVVLVGLVVAGIAAPAASPTPAARPKTAGAAGTSAGGSAGDAAPATPPRAQTAKVSWVSSLTLAPFF